MIRRWSWGDKGGDGVGSWGSGMGVVFLEMGQLRVPGADRKQEVTPSAELEPGPDGTGTNVRLDRLRDENTIKKTWLSNFGSF